MVNSIKQETTAFVQKNIWQKTGEFLGHRKVAIGGLAVFGAACVAGVAYSVLGSSSTPVQPGVLGLGDERSCGANVLLEFKRGNLYDRSVSLYEGDIQNNWASKTAATVIAWWTWARSTPPNATRLIEQGQQKLNEWASDACKAEWEQKRESPVSGEFICKKPGSQGECRSAELVGADFLAEWEQKQKCPTLLKAFTALHERGIQDMPPEYIHSVTNLGKALSPAETRSFYNQAEQAVRELAKNTKDEPGRPIAKAEWISNLRSANRFAARDLQADPNLAGYLESRDGAAYGKEGYPSDFAYHVGKSCKTLNETACFEKIVEKATTTNSEVNHWIQVIDHWDQMSPLTPMLAGVIFSVNTFLALRACWKY